METRKEIEKELKVWECRDFAIGYKKGIQEAIEGEKKDLKQFKEDWRNSSYIMPDFVKDFLEVRNDRIKELIQKLKGDKK